MNHSTDTTEKGLEAHIAQFLVEENKYLLRENKVYDNANCLDSELLFQFFEATQPKAVAKIKTYHKELYEQKIIKRLNDQIIAKGIIEVLRKGITDGFTDTKLMLFYDKPVSAYNLDANKLYQAALRWFHHRWGVRQVLLAKLAIIYFYPPLPHLQLSKLDNQNFQSES